MLKLLKIKLDVGQLAEKIKGNVPGREIIMKNPYKPAK
jgi:hypothetical protein